MRWRSHYRDIMSVRRVVALLLTLFTFHLMLVGPDNVCTMHGHSAQPSAMSGMADHGSPDADMHDGQSKVPCDTPTSAHCCDAFASCAIAVALDAGEQVIAVAPLAEAVAASIDDPLLSRALGPEPPPPKL